MKKLILIAISLILSATVMAQVNVDKSQVKPQVVVHDGKIQLRALKTELGRKYAEAQKIMTELQTMITNMSYEINVADTKTRDEFQSMFENFD